MMDDIKRLLELRHAAEPTVPWYQYASSRELSNWTAAIDDAADALARRMFYMRYPDRDPDDIFHTPNGHFPSYELKFKQAAMDAILLQMAMAEPLPSPPSREE